MIWDYTPLFLHPKIEMHETTKAIQQYNRACSR